MPSAETPVWAAQMARIRAAVSSNGSVRGLHDHVVVAERLPLLELHGAPV